MKFVSNSSPLIFLAKLNFLELLSKNRIFVPEGVKAELFSKESAEKDKLSLFLAQKNITIAKVTKEMAISNSLGNGEMETINLALESKTPDVLMDDRRARSLARIHGLNPHGTLWLILRAHKEKTISKTQAKDIIYELPAIGFRIDQEFLFQVLKKLS